MAIRKAECCVCTRYVYAEDTETGEHETARGARQYYGRWYCGDCYNRQIISGFNPETASYDMEVE